MKFEIGMCSREKFVSSLTNDPADKFAKTFVAKADAMNLWGECYGMFVGDNLAGAVIFTISKKSPKVANLQLLHTFNKYRRNKVGSNLMAWAYVIVMSRGAEYFRVSAEPEAVPFYESIGFKFWGLQKSGCSLSIHKINKEDPRTAIYDDNDPVIRAALYSGHKGSLASSYREKSTLNAILDES